MVSSLLVEALSSPTEALLELYNAQSSETHNDFPAVVTKHFSDVFKVEDAFREIRPLDVDHPPESFPDRSLVRFRCMVQDTSPSPEMYLSKTKSGGCAGWGLAAITSPNAEDDGDDINYADLRDCSVVWAVSVPGESNWWKEALDKHERVTATESTHVHKPTRPHKNPLAKDPHVGVQVKMYDLPGNDAPKTCDILNFVGILTSEPLHSEIEDDNVVDVPTLHVLFTRPHEMDVLPPTLSSEPDSSNLSEEAVLDELVSWVADESLGGDKDAAEWILLISIARVQSRTRSLLPPSLTLAHFPSPSPSHASTSALSHILSLLLPTSVTVPLSLELLNESAFVPESKNEDLHSGVLQVSDGTTLLLTESGVREGKLVERGVLNVMAVQNVMLSQSLPYKFPFSEFSFPTDLSFIVLAEGKKSTFLKTDINVPLKPNTPDVDLYKPANQISLPTPAKMRAFRSLLFGAKNGKIEVAGSTSERIQDDFVEGRKTNKNLSSDDLKLSITTARCVSTIDSHSPPSSTSDPPTSRSYFSIVAAIPAQRVTPSRITLELFCERPSLMKDCCDRLLGLLRGEKELSVDTWTRAKALEERRKARLENRA